MHDDATAVVEELDDDLGIHSGAGRDQGHIEAAIDRPTRLELHDFERFRRLEDVEERIVEHAWRQRHEETPPNDDHVASESCRGFGRIP